MLRKHYIKVEYYPNFPFLRLQWLDRLKMSYPNRTKFQEEEEVNQNQIYKKNKKKGIKKIISF